MFQSSQYDGGAFPSSQSTESQTPNPTKVWGAQGLMPVTVKQLNEAYHSGDDKSFTVDGVEVTNVTLLGRVCNKSVRVTDVSFSLDDGTGCIDCRRWVNEAADSLEMEDIYDGVYVRVVGNLKSAQGRNQIVAFAVRPVTNFDEVSFHFIDCIHHHLQKSKLKTGGMSSPLKVELSRSLPSSNNTLNGNTIGSAPVNVLSSNYTMDGLKSSDQKVLEFLQQNYAQEKGVHRDEISTQLKIPADKIMDSIRILEEEGLIYSTIDEYHYKSTTEG
ncbi:hypothetical protein MLD38_039498 [Melastoma candidum]|uniref:Uncharacterized protein n=1 Tax=Melastoma candidum TaxID=119954 RepID=A0ACB9L361_9MYRT|nr:hypothetical protein MLD38_039498 [Melastoma candidum]